MRRGIFWAHQYAPRVVCQARPTLRHRILMGHIANIHPLTRRPQHTLIMLKAVTGTSLT